MNVIFYDLGNLLYKYISNTQLELLVTLELVNIIKINNIIIFMLIIYYTPLYIQIYFFIIKYLIENILIR